MQASVRVNVDYAISNYGDHPAYLRIDGRPAFYAYDSYQIATEDWDQAFSTGEKAWYMIGLVLHDRHLDDYIHSTTFDGMYTYFGAQGFTQAATPSHWHRYVLYAAEANKKFIPCVAPGYNDMRVRPWSVLDVWCSLAHACLHRNGENKRDREDGAYYNNMWAAAIHSEATVIGVTSFNEWHEGTQIEESVPHVSIRPGIAPYEDYGKKVQLVKQLKRPPFVGSRGPAYYLELTRHWAEVFLSHTAS